MYTYHYCYYYYYIIINFIIISLLLFQNYLSYKINYFDIIVFNELKKFYVCFVLLLSLLLLLLLLLVNYYFKIICHTQLTILVFFCFSCKIASIMSEQCCIMFLFTCTDELFV